MNIEYEAMFKDVNKEDIRNKLKSLNAELVKPEFLQKRIIFELPGGQAINKWVRLRDEGDKITLTYKEITGGVIDGQREILVTVNDFEKTKRILEKTGLTNVAHQENHRELWILDGVEVYIDTWPFINTLVEVEGKNEEEVKRISEKIGFDYSKAIFASVEVLYSEKYGINKLDLCKIAPVLKFDTENPFL